MRAFDEIVVTCEHASARVPARYAPLFRRGRSVLDSHRGRDAGAAAAARHFARRFHAPLHVGRVTRLLVDLNRSLRSHALFSEFTVALTAQEKRRLVARYWEPYRAAVISDIARRIDAGRSVLHLSFHSFTPVWKGEVRNADLGLLYDPARRRERGLCAAWQAGLRECDRGLHVRCNYPYLGIADGLTRALRPRFPGRAYAGIEIEINQALVRRNRPPRAVLEAMASTLAPYVRTD